MIGTAQRKKRRSVFPTHKYGIRHYYKCTKPFGEIREDYIILACFCPWLNGYIIEAKKFGNDVVIGKVLFEGHFDGCGKPEKEQYFYN